MVNSDKGQNLWNEVLKRNDKVLCELCLSEDYVAYQHNLSSPTEKQLLADQFKEDYKDFGFEYVIKNTLIIILKGKLGLH